MPLQAFVAAWITSRNTMQHLIVSHITDWHPAAMTADEALRIAIKQCAPLQDTSLAATLNAIRDNLQECNLR